MVGVSMFPLAEIGRHDHREGAVFWLWPVSEQQKKAEEKLKSPCGCGICKAHPNPIWAWSWPYFEAGLTPLIEMTVSFKRPQP